MVPVCALIRQFAEVERKIDGNPERLMTRRAKIETWSFDLPRRRRRRALCQFLYFYISWLHDYESLAINYFRDTLDTFASIYHTHTHTHTHVLYTVHIRVHAFTRSTCIHAYIVEYIYN